MSQGKYSNPQPREKKRKKKVRHNKKITCGFYCFYGVLILAFVIAMIWLASWLKDWLVEFEAAQPENASVEVFSRYFEDPDWLELYEMADKVEGKKFDTAEEFAAHMEQQLGNAEITMVKTSAGLSGGKKYIARAMLSDGSSYDFATFTLQDKKAEGAAISDWKLSEVVLRVKFPGSSDNTPVTTYDYTFRIHPDNKVTVNGKLLDESYVVRSVTTKAEEYLPDGIHGYRMVDLYIDGLTAEPEVEITDAQGNPVEVTYDEDSRTYVQDLTVEEIPEEEKTALLNAAMAYGKYMIGAPGASLSSHFDSNSQIYKNIINSDSWMMQDYTGYAFSEEKVITGYYRYSDTLYSAKISMSLAVTRKNGTQKMYEVEQTFFMEKQGSKWKVIEMLNMDVQEQLITVRMSYLHTDGTLIRQDMVDAGAKVLGTPAVTAPEGQEFRGWATKTVTEEGGNVFTLIYRPDEDGKVNLPAQNTLEPMVLYAVFAEIEES